MPLVPKRLLSILKPKQESTSSTPQNTYGEEDNDTADNPDGIDIISLLWERNMVMIIRHIFKLTMQLGQVGTCRQVCRVWNSIIEHEILPYLNHTKITRKWFHGQIKVTDLEYLTYLGGATNEEVVVYQIVPLEKFTFILLTKCKTEHVLMVYELEQFKACVNLPLPGMTTYGTMFKLGKNTVNLIYDRNFIMIISLDTYRIICDKLVINSTCTSLHDMRKMQELTWSDFRHDGSLAIIGLTDKEPFYEVVQNIPGAKNFAKPHEMIISLIGNSFHREIIKNKKTNHVVMRTQMNHSGKERLRLVNLLSKKVEYKSSKQYFWRYFLSDKYFIYATWNQLYTITTVSIKRLSDGLEKQVTLPNPELKDLIDCPGWDTPLDFFLCQTLPGSDVVMLCYAVVRGHAADVLPISHQIVVYFIDLEKGALIGSENAGLGIRTDPLGVFKMVTPSMFLVAASGFGRQRCILFRMSDNKEVHKRSRDITQGVAEALGGITRAPGFLRAHIDHRDPQSSPQVYAGNDHLIFSLEDSEIPLNWNINKVRKGVSYSKIYFVKFC